MLANLPDYVHVIRKPVKRLSLRILDDASVRFTLPKNCPEREAMAFYASKQHWIAQKRAGMQERGSAIEFTCGEILLHDRRYQFIRASAGKAPEVDHQFLSITNPLDLNQQTLRLGWYRSYAKRYLPGRLEQFSEEHHLPIGRITIRDQRSRWGSCSAKQNISLNWRLVLMPEWVSDAVLLHELTHTKEMNHGPKFYALVNAICPEHENSGHWLKQYGSALLQIKR